MCVVVNTTLHCFIHPLSIIHYNLIKYSKSDMIFNSITTNFEDKFKDFKEEKKSGL